MNFTPATADADCLPPAAWRSEAFAEDLCDDDPAPAAPQRAAAAVLLGALPLLLAGVLLIASTGA
jgi:hypothetical protein